MEESKTPAKIRQLRCRASLAARFTGNAGRQLRFWHVSSKARRGEIIPARSGGARLGGGDSCAHLSPHHIIQGGVFMSDVRQQICEIVARMGRRKTAEDVARAQSFEELELDSIGLMAVLDEIEDTFHIKLPEDPDATITVPEFVDLIERLVAEKNA
jgi:acyl carrier protein